MISGRRMALVCSCGGGRRSMLRTNFSATPPSALRSGVFFLAPRIPSSSFACRTNHVDAAAWRCSAHSLVETVIQELRNSRSRLRKVVRAPSASKLALTSSGELLEDKLVNRALEEGFLLEFKKDSEKVLLAVAQRPDGKKNWMVSDQNGVTSSIKPQQITFIVPGVENFDPSKISDFVSKAEVNLDPTLLEFAWAELLEQKKPITPEALAEMIFGCSEPLESYCAHRLLSKDEIYFSVLQTKGSVTVYTPRPVAQVEELMRRRIAQEAAEKELKEFVDLLKSAKSMPFHAKPAKSTWLMENKHQEKIKSLECFAIENFISDEQRKTAAMILKAMGLTKIASSAVNLLIDIGYFPVHVNLDLLKLELDTPPSDEVISAAMGLLSESDDPDEVIRMDLSQLKVYAIDVDEADEVRILGCP